MSDDVLRRIQDAILATDPQDVETINLLKDQYQRARTMAGAAQKTALPPAGASGAPDRGGSTAAATDLPSPRTVAAVAATAPAKGVAGLLDFGGETLKLAGRAIKLPVADLMGGSNAPRLTPLVDRLTDELAGVPVGNSVGRSAFEGAITGPLSGGNTARQIAAQMAAGGAAGATADAANRAGANPLIAALAAMGAGAGAGKAVGAVGTRPSEMVAKGRLARAGEGLTPEDFAAGKVAHGQARAEGINLLPSQALQTQAPGFEDLQGALLRSRADRADGFRTDVAKQPKQVEALVKGLQTRSGQQPRMDDQLASDVQKAAEQLSAEGPRAVNAATKPLYNDPAARNTSLKPEVIERMNLGLEQAIFENRANSSVVAMLKDAQKHLASSLEFGKPTLGILADALEDVKRSVGSREIYPTGNNHSREVVFNTLRPLDDLLAGYAPARAAAPKIQAKLRSDLPSDFNEVLRQAGTSGGTDAALTAAAKRPELLSGLAKTDPKLAQEVVQRSVNSAVQKALEPSSTTNLPPANSGIIAKRELTKGLEGRAFDQSLELLFPGRPEAATGFKRVLDVVANASKPRATGGSGSEWAPGLPSEAVRGVVGSKGQQAGVLARMTGNVFGKMKDNATIKVLSRPDVMERLERLAALPTPRLTQAAVIGALPQLFEEASNEP